MALPVRLSRVAAAVVVLTCLSSAPYVQFSVRVTHDALSRTGWPFVYSYFGAALLSVALFVIDVRPSLRSASEYFALAPVSLFGAWALLSAGWSYSPDETPIQAMLMAALLLFAVWFGRTLSRLEQGVSLFVVTHGLTIASWLIVIVAPTSTMNAGFWVGVFANRNSLAPIAVLAAITAIAVLLRCGVRSAWSALALPLLLADIYVVIKAGSDTAAVGFVAALLAAAVALSVTTLWRRRGWRPTTLAMGVVMSAVVGWFVSFAVIDRLATALNTAPSVSNRRAIWRDVRTQFSERPLFGYGFGSFWNDPDRVDKRTGLPSFSYFGAHSTFLETVLGLGVVGGVLLVIIWLQVAWGVGRTMWVEWQSPRSVAPVVMVTVFAFVENLTESMITLHSLFWVVLVSAAFIRPVSHADA